MKTTELLNDFFTFEMANNHQGDIAHAEQIIKSMAEIARDFKIKAAIKFQLRNLDTFIHPDYADDYSLKYVKRFKETKLDKSQLRKLIKMVKDNGLIPMATVFDEDSIEDFIDLKFEILKIASCSAVEIPLLKKLKKLDVLTILSTGSLLVDQIKDAVRYLGKDKTKLAIMHCVTIYPTDDHDLMMNRIDDLIAAFPGYKIGFSTHEHPNSYLPVQLAMAKGVAFFEKHVDVESKKYKMNKYSANPDQVRSWLKAYSKAKEMCDLEKRSKIRERELENIYSLKRAIFAKSDIKAGSVIRREEVFFAIPPQESQLLAEQFEDKILKAIKDISINDPINPHCVERLDGPDGEIAQIITKTFDLLTKSGIKLPKKYTLEISHHYGVDSFEKHGAVLINLLNRAYCKKYLIMFKAQIHPAHHHEDRSESLCLIHGQVDIKLNGNKQPMEVGEFIDIDNQCVHEFIAKADSIIEEISTTYHRKGSVYKDASINEKAMHERKIFIDVEHGEWVRR